MDPPRNSEMPCLSDTPHSFILSLGQISIHSSLTIISPFNSPLPEKFNRLHKHRLFSFASFSSSTGKWILPWGLSHISDNSQTCSSEPCNHPYGNTCRWCSQQWRWPPTPQSRKLWQSWSMWNYLLCNPGTDSESDLFGGKSLNCHSIVWCKITNRDLRKYRRPCKQYPLPRLCWTWCRVRRCMRWRRTLGSCHRYR